MARRRKFRYAIDPITKASAVIVAFKSKISNEKELNEMQKKYRAQLENYSKDTDKQKWAVFKLAGYYIGLNEPEVKDAIRNAIALAKKRQTEFVAPYVSQMPPAGITEDVKSLASAVAAIIRGGAPAPRPAV